MNTPILETARLILRPFQQDDAKDVFHTWESDPDVARYMFWTSHNDIQKTRDWLSFEIGQIDKNNWYRFAIVLKVLGKRVHDRGHDSGNHICEKNTEPHGNCRQIRKGKPGLRTCAGKASLSI